MADVLYRIRSALADGRRLNDAVATEAADEIDRLRSLTTWQPIETAPKDLAILIYATGFYVGHYNTAYERWCTYTDGSKTAGERLLNSWNPPTHWMPLPTPPEADI